MNDYQFCKVENILRDLVANEKTDKCPTINSGAFEILVNILKKKVLNIDEDITYDLFSSYPCLISEEESEVVNNAEKWLYQKVTIDVNDLPSTSSNALEMEAMSRNIVGNKPSKSKNKTQNELKEERAQRFRISKNRVKLAKSLTVMRSLTTDDLKQVHIILKNLDSLYQNEFQTNMNGSPSNNLWIVKPASKSRGKDFISNV